MTLGNIPFTNMVPAAEQVTIPFGEGDGETFTGDQMMMVISGNSTNANSGSHPIMFGVTCKGTYPDPIEPMRTYFKMSDDYLELSGNTSWILGNTINIGRQNEGRVFLHGHELKISGNSIYVKDLES